MCIVYKWMKHIKNATNSNVLCLNYDWTDNHSKVSLVTINGHMMNTENIFTTSIEVGRILLNFS